MDEGRLELEAGSVNWSDDGKDPRRAPMTQGKKRQSAGPAEARDMRRQDGDMSPEEMAFLEPHIQEQLGRVFRSYCDDLIHQPIPDKFAVLLAQLEARQREKK